MARLHQCLTNVLLDLLWRLRPFSITARTRSHRDLTAEQDPHADETVALRSLVQRFPYWKRGRALLGQYSLMSDDVATAYAESQALRLLSREGSTLRATSLALLGRCYLKRGDGISAISLLSQASQLRPKDTTIREDEAAAHVLLGDKSKALEILEGIPTPHLSAEGKAALQWLSMRES